VSTVTKAAPKAGAKSHAASAKAAKAASVKAAKAAKAAKAPTPAKAGKPAKVPREAYEAEMERLQLELTRMKDWVMRSGARVAVLFEGRDAAGKGGVIKRITENLSPRVVRVAALPAPSEREQGQWYFERYIEHLPARGEVVLFDRSWYNRSGVERVMGFCTDEEYRLFLKQAPVLERLLLEDGIVLLKYWFSVSDDEQERRFRARIDDPLKQWKLSPMDLASRTHWVDYSKAKDAMFAATDLPDTPWWVVEADDKRRARINCISHLLAQLPYDVQEDERVSLPPRQEDPGYERPPSSAQRHVPDVAAEVGTKG